MLIFVTLPSELKLYGMEKSFLFLADGFEEVEAITVMDVLRRGGVELVTVSIYSHREVRGAHGIPVVADTCLKDIAEKEEGSCLLFPGGMPGAKNLSEEPRLISWMQRHFDQGKLLAAICAAPALVFSKLQTGRECRMTCYPGFESYLPHALLQPEGVVTDGHLITGKGPAAALDFGLTVLARLTSPATARQVAEGMLKSEVTA